MKKNIGKKDRLFRLAIAIALLIYAFIQKSPWAFLGSLFVFFEAAMSWCIFYQLIGKNSCPLDKR